MSVFFQQVAVRIRPAFSADKYGDSSDADWAGAEHTEMPGVNVQPEPTGQGVGETQGDRNPVIERWRLISPKGMPLDIRSTDRVLADGILMEVDGGTPAYHLGGNLHHVEIRLRKVSG